MRLAAHDIVAHAGSGARLSDDQARALAEVRDLGTLAAAARARRDREHGGVVSYSPKVFIPLTHLCRDVCRYCTFARTPRPGTPAYLAPEQVLAIARAGADAGCHEALFTLGDAPEKRYRVAREALAALGHRSTLGYLAEVAALVRRETGLLPHLNPGVMSREDLDRLRAVSASCGLMLESASRRLCAPGGPHHGCPDKEPEIRLSSIRAAGRAAVPLTSGILIGIGETRRERIESLLALRDAHETYGHLQEVIVQNFRAKPDTVMAHAAEPALEDHLWTLAVARLVLPPEVSLQAPPNLNAHALDGLLESGINDFGGISPVTLDHVNPEMPWPRIEVLERACRAAGKALVPRLPIYPRYAREPERWLHPEMRAPVLARQDAEGFARDSHWRAGDPGTAPPAPVTRARAVDADLHRALDRLDAGAPPSHADLVRLFSARGADVAAVCERADALRRRVSGDTVSYVVNRNVNYTNLCYFGCRFCAFSKGRGHEALRGAPYDISHEEIARRTAEAWERGATEICLQGGIHPDYTGQSYLDIVRTVKAAAPQIHVHAFSPLEVWQGALSSGLGLREFLARLAAEGLDSLPGTAAEVLDDAVRAVICPDKISTAQWLEVMATAHALGLRSTATIMFGHVDGPHAWARHLLRVRELAAATGGFTEFVPLPYVHMESPLFRQGRSRMGPTWREAVLVHAVARLALHPHIENIQASWVKLGPRGLAACLDAGANDAGGTLMNESITRAAGAAFGEEMPPHAMDELIRGTGRTPRQRTTFYGDAPASRIEAARSARELTPPELTPAKRAPRRGRAAPLRFGT